MITIDTSKKQCSNCKHGRIRRAQCVCMLEIESVSLYHSCEKWEKHSHPIVQIGFEDEENNSQR